MFSSGDRLALDDAGLLETTLPRNRLCRGVRPVPEQPPARWSVIGMSILAESPAEVAHFLRAVPRLAREKKLFAARDLLQLAEFPEAGRITPFYVASVSLVDFLVRLKGAHARSLCICAKRRDAATRKRCNGTLASRTPTNCRGAGSSSR